MRLQIICTAVLLVGLGVQVQAQAPFAAPLASRPTVRFHTSAPRIARSAAVKRGMIIGGVTGAGIAAILVFSRPCRGDDCWTRSAVAILPIGLGAAVGIVVGGAIANGMAQDHDFAVAGATIRRAARRVSVGLRLSLPNLHSAP